MVHHAFHSILVKAENQFQLEFVLSGKKTLINFKWISSESIGPTKWISTTVSLEEASFWSYKRSNVSWRSKSGKNSIEEEKKNGRVDRLISWNLFQRDRRSDPALPLSVIDPSEKLLADRRGPPPILEIDSGRRTPLEAATSFRPEPQVQTTAPKKNERLTEYQSRYKSIAEQKKPATRKSYEAEWAIERVNLFEFWKLFN